MQLPLISVLMPVFNEERFVSAAIKSILSQSFVQFEFIIIDDGSTDCTPIILKRWAKQDPRIRVIVQENAGITKALNNGLKFVRGAFVARMDANDISMSSRFAAQLAHFEKFPDCVAVGGAVDLIDEDGAVLTRTNFASDHEDIIDGLFARVLRPELGLPHAAAMIRADAISRIGGYREKFVAAQDRDLWLRLAEVGTLSNVSDVVIQIRVEMDRGISVKSGEIQNRCAIEAIQDAYGRRGEVMPKETILWPAVSSCVQRRLWAARMASSSGHSKTAIKHALRAIATEPSSMEAWRSFRRFCMTHFKTQLRPIRDRLRKILR